MISTPALMVFSAAASEARVQALVQVVAPVVSQASVLAPARVLASQASASAPVVLAQVALLAAV